MKKHTSRFLLMTAFAVCIAASCTHKPYHPEKSDREWAADHEACEQSVREGVRDEPYAYDDFDEMRLSRRCMREKGWQWERTNWGKFKKNGSNE